MSLSAGTVEFSAKIDWSQVEKDARSRFKDQSYTITFKTDESELTSANKHLESKRSHVESIQRYLDRNPLTFRVDTSEIDEAVSKLEEFKKLNKETSGKQKTGTSSGTVGEDLHQTLEQFTEDLGKAINKGLLMGVDAATTPIRQALGGAFFGIGNPIGKAVGEGMKTSLESAIGASFENISRNFADSIMDGFGRSRGQSRQRNDEMTTSLALAPSRQSNLLIAVTSEDIDKAVVEIKKTVQEKVNAIGSISSGGGTISTSSNPRKPLNINSIETIEKEADLARENASRVIKGFQETAKAFNKSNKGLSDIRKKVRRFNQLGETKQKETIEKLERGVISAYTVLDNYDRAVQEINRVAQNLPSDERGRFLASLSRSRNRAKEFVGYSQGLVNNPKSRSEGMAGLQIDPSIYNQLLQGGEIGAKAKQIGKQIGDEITKGAQDSLEIRSPSRRWEREIGRELGRGVARGWDRSNVDDHITDNFDDMTDEMRDRARRQNYGRQQQRPPSTADLLGRAQSFAQERDIPVHDMAAALFSVGTGASGGLLPAGMALAPLLMSAIPIVLTSAIFQGLASKLITRVEAGLERVARSEGRLQTLTRDDPERTPDTEFDYLNDVAERYNVSLSASVENFSQLATAARGTKLEGDGVRELFEGISASIGALRLSTADANLVFNAYTQLLAKGRISSEELRQQLGEKFPPAMNIFAQSLNKSVPEMVELIEKGALLSEEVLPKVGKTLISEFGEAAEASAGGYISAMNRVESAQFNLDRKLQKEFGGIVSFFKNLNASITDLIANNLETLKKLGQALTIGMVATTAVALQQIMQMGPVKKALDFVRTITAGSVGISGGLLVPFFAGSFVDIADDFLGADRSIIDNMVESFTSAFEFAFQKIQLIAQEKFGKDFYSFLIPAEGEGFNPFQAIAKGWENLTDKIPSGLVEFGALVIMFEQLRVLGNLFLIPQFKMLGKTILQVGGAFATTLRKTGTFVEIIKNLFGNTALLNQQLTQMRGQFLQAFKGIDFARIALTGFQIAAEAAVAVLVMSLARSDFTDDLIGDFYTLENSVIASIQNIGEEIDKLGERFNEAGDQLESLADRLPSKGLELSLRTIFLGDENSSFTTDDLINDINKRRQKEVRKRQNISKRFPFLDPLMGVTNKRQTLEQQRKKEADELGIGDFFTGNEVYNTLGQEQLLIRFRQLNKLREETFGTRLRDANLTPDTIDGFLQQDEIQKAIAQTKEYEAELQALANQRSQVALQGTPAAKEETKKIDEQIQAVIDSRKELAERVGEIQTSLNLPKAQLENLIKGLNQEIEETLDPNLQASYQKLLKFFEARLKDQNIVIDVVTEAGLFDSLNPLVSIWEEVIKNITDANLAFERFNQNLKLATTARKIDLFKEARANNLNPSQVQQRQGVIDASASVREIQSLARITASRQSALGQLLSIQEVDKNKDRRQRIEELRKNLASDREKLAQTQLSLERNLYEQQQARIKLENQKETLLNQQQTLDDEIAAFIESFQDFQRSLEMQLIQSAIAIKDTEKEILQLRVKNKLTENLPAGVSSLTESTIDLFANLFASQERFNTENEDKQLSRLDAEQKTLEIAKQIKGFHDQRADLEDKINDYKEKLLEYQDKFNDLQTKSWNEILKEYNKVEQEINQLGLNLDDIGEEVDEQGNRLIEALENLTSRVNGVNSSRTAIASPASNNLFQRLVLAEAQGEGLLGMAAVARTVFNRQALIQSGKVSAGTYNAKSGSLEDIINASGQYQPVSDGSINRNFTEAQLKSAAEAIALAFNSQKFTQLLAERLNFDLEKVGRITEATGFRTAYAFNDASQNYNTAMFGNHRFNSDRFAIQENVRQITDSYFNEIKKATETAELNANVQRDRASMQSAVEQLAQKYGIDQLAIVDPKGNTIGLNQRQNPKYAASIIKLAVAEVAQEALKSNNLKLQDKITITPDITTSTEPIKAGETMSVYSALESMLTKSSNVAFNALVNKLGGFDKVNEQLDKLGYESTRIYNYLANGKLDSPEGKNLITAEDASKLLSNLYDGSSRSADFVTWLETASKQDPFIGQHNDIGGKHGITSSISGYSGITEIGGEQFTITAYQGAKNFNEASQNLKDNLPRFFNALTKLLENPPQPKPVTKPKPQPTTQSQRIGETGGGAGDPQAGSSTGPHLDVKVANLDEVVSRFGRLDATFIDAVAESRGNAGFTPAELDKYIQIGGKPLSQWSVTSGYGPRNLGDGFHAGIDFGTPSGSAVELTGGARLIRSETGHNQGFGGSAIVELPDGRVVALNHLRKVQSVTSQPLQISPLQGLPTYEEIDSLNILGDQRKEKIEREATLKLEKQAEEQKQRQIELQRQYNSRIFEGNQAIRETLLFLRDSEESMQSLLLDSQPFLTVQQEIDKAVQGITHSFRDAIESREKEIQQAQREIEINQEVIQRTKEQLEQEREKGTLTEDIINQVNTVLEQAGIQIGLEQEKIIQLREEGRILEANKQSAVELTREYENQKNALSQRGYETSLMTELLDLQSGAIANPFESSRLERQSRMLQQELSFDEASFELEEYIQKQGLSTSEAQKLRDTLEQINQIKLNQITEETDFLKSSAKDITRSGLDSFFSSVFDNINNLGEAFRSFVLTVLKGIADIAAQIATNAIIEGLFGNLLGGIGGGGGASNPFTSASSYSFATDISFAKKGLDLSNNLVPFSRSRTPENYLSLGMGVSRAMDREGIGAIPVVANRREMILNPEDSQLARSLFASGEWEAIKDNYRNSAPVVANYRMGSDRAMPSRGGNTYIDNRNVVINEYLQQQPAYSRPNSRQRDREVRKAMER